MRNGRRARPKRRRRHSNRRSNLWIIWLLYVLFLSVVGTVVLMVLWGRLYSYQKEIDEEARKELLDKDSERAPQLTFEAYMKDRTAVWWCDMLRESRERAGEDSLEPQADLVAYFEDALAREGKARLYKDESWTKTHPVYRARLGEAIAVVSMEGSGTDWDVGEVTVSAAGEYGGRLEAPLGVAVYCGETELDDSYVDGDVTSHFPFDGSKDRLDAPVMWQTYAVTGLLVEPHLSVDEGAAAWSSADSCAVIRTQDEWGLKSRGEDFLRSYLTLTVYGKDGYEGHLSDCLSRVRRGSEAYEVLNALRSSISQTMAHSGLRIADLAVDEPIKWADNAVSVDYTYHAYARRGGAEIDYSREDECLRVLFLRDGESWGIQAFQTLNP